MFVTPADFEMTFSNDIMVSKLSYQIVPKDLFVKVSKYITNNLHCRNEPEIMSDMKENELESAEVNTLPKEIV